MFDAGQGANKGARMANNNKNRLTRGEIRLVCKAEKSSWMRIKKKAIFRKA